MIRDPRPDGAGVMKAATSRPRRISRRWMMVLATCAGLALVGYFAWPWFTLPRRASAAVPAQPALETWPSELEQRLAAAERRIGDRSETIEALTEVARLYHANGFRAEAAACWQFLRLERPGVAQWNHMLADLHRAASDYEGMEARLREVVQLDPRYSPAWLKLGDHLLKTGRLEEARHAYSERLARLPDDPYAMLGQARVAMLSDQRAEARRLLDRIVAEHVRFSPAHNLLAEILSAEGDEIGAARRRQLGNVAIRYFEAEDPWLDELVAWCYDPERLRILATIEYQIERGDRGVALMERAVRLAPRDAGMHSSLGDLHVKLGDGPRAREALERALQLAHGQKPPIADFLNLSHAYRLLERPIDAWRVADRAKAVHPEAPEVYDELGIVFGELGRLAEAIVAFQRAIELNPANADTNIRLAVTLLESGRRPEAYAALARALAPKPSYPPALSLLAKIELEDERLDEAEGHLRVLHDAYPDVHESRFLLGVVHLIRGKSAQSAGDPAAAERFYREGLAIDASNPDLQREYGALMLAQGRGEAAILPLEACRRLQPDNPQAALDLGRAYAQLRRIEQARTVLTEGVAQADRAGNADVADACRELLRHLGSK